MKRQRQRHRQLMIGAMLAGMLAAAAARPAAAAEEENDYGKQGTLELGGGLDFLWTSEVYTLGLTPSIGYFVHDRIELSLRLSGTYENEREADGTRAHSTVGSLVLEPSYHLPIGERLYFFAGLGVGGAYGGTHPEFDLLPRLGLNIEVGRSGVVSPAVRVPILIGKVHGPGDDTEGIAAGVGFEIGFSTTF